MRAALLLVPAVLLLQPVPVSLAAAIDPALVLDRLLTARELGLETPLEAFDTWSLNAADLDGDALPEIVSLNDDSRLYVIDPRAPRALAALETRHAGGATTWRTQELNGVALGDVDGDANADLAVLNAGGGLTLLEADGAGASFRLVERWHRLVAAPEFDEDFYDSHSWLRDAQPADEPFLAHGHPFIARVDGPSEPATIFTQSDGLPGAFAFRADGTLRWMDAWQDGHAGPVVATLAPGADPLALFATDAGAIVARDARTGAEEWRFDARDAGAWPGSFAVPPVPADLDGDGTLELFVAARVAVEDPRNPRWPENQRARLILLDSEGTVKWSTQLGGGNPLVHMRAVPLDANEDGVKDLVVLDWNTIGHKPGRWERLGDANLFALDGRTGSALWRARVDADWTRFNVPIASFEPGRLGVLVPHAREGVAGLSVVDARSGEHRAFAALPSGWNATRGAALVDVDRDGLLEAIVPVARPAESCAPKEDVPCREGALAVYRTRAAEETAVFANNDPYSAERVPAAPPPPKPAEVARPAVEAREPASAARESFAAPVARDAPEAAAAPASGLPEAGAYVAVPLFAALALAAVGARARKAPASVRRFRL